MQQAAEPVVFKGMTAAQLSAYYNPLAPIPDLPAYMQETVELSKRAAAACPPVARDVAYGETELEKLDIYAPKGAKSAPVLIDIHGGGFTMGSKNGRAIPAPAVTAAGVVWVPIDYGLAPSFKMDQMVGHVRKAVAWVHANIAKYGGDPDRLFVSGNSAGGYMTAATLMPGWHGDYGIPADAIKGAVPMSGLFDLEPIVLSSEGPNQALKMTMEDAKRLSPVRHVPKNGCPIIVTYGAPEVESFIEQSEDFAKAWAAAGAPVETIVVPGAHHQAMGRELADPDGTLFKAVMKLIGV